MKIAKNFGINDKTIYNWIKFYKKENNIKTPINETKNQPKFS
ncbi:helix-turn-helix domain containing protein [Aliarcobacter cryaerophilus]|nr:helix-turn-helix domain containing protein [Aliarcobacter cryaerophilus]